MHGPGLAVAMALGLALAAGPGAAQDYPAKPVRIIVTFSPGGFTDVTARIVAQHWTERFGQPVLVENRPGASTVLGTELVARANPDGHTLLFTGSSTFSIVPIVLRAVPYDPFKSFAYIGIVGSTAMMLLAHPSVPAASLKDLVALLAKPGAPATYGSFGTGTASHFAAELLWAALGTRPLHIPYKGSGPLMAALVAGEVPLSVDTVVVGAPQIRAGKIKAFAVTTATRSTLLADIPTLAESGYPGFDVGAWVALAAPAGTPEAVLKRLRSETIALRDVASIRERFTALGVDVVGSSAEDMASKIKADTERYARIAREANIRPE